MAHPGDDGVQHFLGILVVEFGVGFGGGVDEIGEIILGLFTVDLVSLDFSKIWKGRAPIGGRIETIDPFSTLEDRRKSL
jgi:hypothetical protein